MFGIKRPSFDSEHLLPKHLHQHFDDVAEHHHRHHHHYHDNFFSIHCDECTAEAKLKKSPSESSEVTVADAPVPIPEVLPFPASKQHPPKYRVVEGEIDYQPIWIPNPESPYEKDRPRTLVLCFDGTGDQFDDDNSNVVQLLSCLKKNDKERQLVYYQTGIGTTTTSNFFTPVMKKVSETLDSMFAWNLSSHVQDGYQFIMQNYKAGDRISIFGFSRGAYTARALAGMVQRVGLLPADNIQQIPFAWSMYIREDEKAEEDSAEYKRTFSSNVIIDFVGVWDTVASVGIASKELPFVRNNTAIRVFRHAIALDEHRAKFMPNFYHDATPSQAEKAETPASLEAGSGVPSSPAPLVDVSIPRFETPFTVKPSSYAVYPKKERNEPTDACEVWFAGCHCDVGGGSVLNATPHSLARIPLRWMIRECFRMKTGIIFDARQLQEVIGLDARTVYPEVLRRPERRTADAGAVIERRKSQGSAILSFIKFLFAVMSLPVRIVFAVILWPVRHAWLFLKYTKPIKSIRHSKTVRWIRKKPMKWARKNLGLDWAAGTLKAFGSWIISKISPKAPEPRPCASVCQTEEDHEYYDALSPIYDQMEISLMWRIMEYLPLRFVKQKKGRDDYYVAMNKGQGRKIYGDAFYRNVAAHGTKKSNDKAKGFLVPANVPMTSVTAVPTLRHTQGTYRQTGGLKIHRSVKTRLEVLDKNGQSLYKPLAWWGRRKGLGEGKKGPKTRGPDRWNIENPDPVKYWEWVE